MACFLFNNIVDKSFEMYNKDIFGEKYYAMFDRYIVNIYP